MQAARSGRALQPGEAGSVTQHDHLDVVIRAEPFGKIRKDREVLCEPLVAGMHDHEASIPPGLEARAPAIVLINAEVR